jgi:hypothetical protein
MYRDRACPHEEGIDDPIGRTCPRCPFWAGIDRFTHEPVTPTVPTMAPAEILTDLSSDEPEPPREALESADGHGLCSLSHCYARSIAASPIRRMLCRKRRRSSVMRCTCSPNGGSLAHTHTLSDGCRCRATHHSTLPGMSSRRTVGGLWLQSAMETWSRSKHWSSIGARTSTAIALA